MKGLFSPRGPSSPTAGTSYFPIEWSGSLIRTDCKSVQSGHSLGPPSRSMGGRRRACSVLGQSQDLQKDSLAFAMKSLLVDTRIPL